MKMKILLFYLNLKIETKVPMRRDTSASKQVGLNFSDFSESLKGGIAFTVRFQSNLKHCMLVITFLNNLTMETTENLKQDYF